MKLDDMTDGGIDLDADLIEIEPQIRWDHDKWPNWLPGLPLKAKGEIGVAMARLGATTTDFIELSYSPAHRVQVRFRRPDDTHTDFLELMSLDRIPETNEQSIKQVIEMNQRNRERMEELMKTGRQNSQAAMKSPMSNIPPVPGGRSYSPGMARWLTQVRLQEQLAGEHPYAYANNNPVRYTDPSGLQAQDPVSGYFNNLFPPGEGVPNWIVPDTCTYRTVSTFDFFSWDYGKCCGLNRRCGPHSKPFDCLDENCKKHDICLATPADFFNPVRQFNCDRAFCNDIWFCYKKNCTGAHIDYKQCHAIWEAGSLYCFLGGMDGPPFTPPYPWWPR